MNNFWLFKVKGQGHLQVKHVTWRYLQKELTLGDLTVVILLLIPGSMSSPEPAGSAVHVSPIWWCKHVVLSPSDNRPKEAQRKNNSLWNAPLNINTSLKYELGRSTSGRDSSCFCGVVHSQIAFVLFTITQFFVSLRLLVSCFSPKPFAYSFIYSVPTEWYQ